MKNKEQHTFPFIERLLDGAEVEWKKLGEISTQISGMSGVSNKWASSGNCRFIDYLNAYKNIKIDICQLPFATVKKLNQTELRQGDILFTSASETPDECAISSVIEDKIGSGIFLDDHLFGIRINEKYKGIIDSSFLNYYFHSPDFRKTVNKAVRGVTRFYISKVAFMRLSIPIPPLSVQRKLVEILDKFTELEAELEAELDCRKRQYEYYRNKLLAFDMLNTPPEKLNSINWLTIKDISKNISSGGTPRSNNATYYGGDIPWLRTQEVNFSDIWDTEVKITKEGMDASSAKYIPANCVIIAMYGATVGRVGINKIPLTTNQACANIEVDENIALYRYVFHYLSSQYEYIRSLGAGSQTNINARIVKGLKIPLPPLSEQQRIVSILDKFDTLTSSISEGLPKEIELRRKQYEYYREQLLSFRH